MSKKFEIVASDQSEIIEKPIEHRNEMNISTKIVFLSGILLFMIFLSLVILFWMKSSMKQKLLSTQSNIFNYQITESPSEIGSSQYECTGSCFCGVSSRRQTTTTTTIQSISYIVTALTGYLAYQKAKKYFSHEFCQSSLSSDCSISNIQSEIQSCEKIEEEEYHHQNIELEKDIRKYFCKGNCLVNGNLKIDYTRNRAIQFGCENYIIEREIELDVKNAEAKNRFAVVSFTSRFLTPHCKMFTKEKYFRISPSGVKQYLTFSKCIGNGSNKGGMNPSVHCIQTYPPPNNSGKRVYWNNETTN